ncbi:MAG: tetratricopeptide repeat protein [Phormidesmis sp. RL_2_1]|nr:tetratricopeptide repeat protein [Phormidesmis sp. RL_2_1]
MLKSAEQGLRCDPQHLPCQLFRVRGLIARWRWDEAMLDIGKILQQQANCSQAFAARGWIHHYKGHRESALRDFKEALRLDPENDWAKQGLMSVLRAQNPLNGMHYVNPYGKALFSAAQIRAHYWLSAAPVALLVGVGGMVLFRRLFIFSSIAAMWVLSYLVVSALRAETARQRQRYWLAVGLAVVAAVALIVAPGAARSPVLLLFGGTAGVLASLCVQDWGEETHLLFRGLSMITAGLCVVGLSGLALAEILPLAAAEILTMVGSFAAKLAIAVFITTALTRLQWH